MTDKKPTPLEKAAKNAESLTEEIRSLLEATPTDAILVRQSLNHALDMADRATRALKEDVPHALRAHHLAEAGEAD